MREKWPRIRTITIGDVELDVERREAREGQVDTPVQRRMPVADNLVTDMQ